MKLLRSVLFAPANDKRKAEKALALGADAVILDLEDAVAYSQKAAARESMREILSVPRQTTVFVRVNAASTEYVLADLMAVVGLPVDGITLAKTETAEELGRVDWLLSLLEQERGLAAGGLDLIPFIETARGIAAAVEIAGACPRVKRLAFGGNDYTMNIGTAYSREGSELFYARSQLVVASRAAGIEAPLDTVNPEIKDTAALTEDARRARNLGFQGKLIIHPAQLAPVNEVFSPTPAEITWAQKVVDAFTESEAQGTAVIQVEGRMVEYPIIKRAQQILAAAKGIADKTSKQS